MNEANTAWILVSTALVLLMTLPGLALFYAGLVGSKNAISTLSQCFIIACIASVIWFVVGYSLAFSGNGMFFGDLDKAFLSGITIDSLSGDIPETLFVMFQMTFAIITPALIVGAYVERIKFSAVIIITSMWLVFVYSPVTHWVWGGGWLAQMGVMDFAGGLVVHTTAGISALAANQNAAMAMLVTHISAAAGTITWMLIDWYKNGKPGLVGMITGMVAGLATVTPASGYIGPLGGLILGISSAFVCYWFVGFIKNIINIDDTLDVFAVHGVGGILGTLLCATLATSYFGGLGLETGVWDQTKTQVIGVISISLYTFAITTIIVMITRSLVGLRVTEQEEITDGLDFGSHGESGYRL